MASAAPTVDLDRNSWTSRWAFPRRLGGPMGSHHGRLSAAWAYVFATLSWLICMARQMPCRQGVLSESPDRFGWMCYTDITALYFSRGQATGGAPYITVDWEYPVLTGYFATIANAISQFFGANLSAGIDGDQSLVNGHIYFAVTAVMLFACLIWLVTSVLRTVPQTPVLAMAVAISPTLWANALINWDLFVIALTAAGLAAWVNKKPVWAGLWWGWAIAAKFYPLVIVGALAVLCVRPEALRTLEPLKAWLKMAGTALAAWLVVNLPMMMTHFSGWAYFYTFNYSDRGADLGSFWYSLTLMGVTLTHASAWSRAVMLIGFGLLAILIYFARKPPSAWQIAYLAVAIMVSANLVYSPQYVLWLLPLIVLCRPRLFDLTLFTAGELIYFVLIWMLLKGDNLTLGISSAPWAYIFAVWLLLGVTIWLMSRVVRDIMHGDPAAEINFDVNLIPRRSLSQRFVTT